MNFNKTSTNNQPNEKKELRECIVLWKKERSHLTFYSGKTVGDIVHNVVAFITKNKKEKKQPDLNIYLSSENNDDELTSVATLWLHESKNGKKYYSGYTNDKEKIIGFFIPNTQNGKYPSIRVYYKD